MDTQKMVNTKSYSQEWSSYQAGYQGRIKKSS
jgi:hypothetical protein